MQLSSRSVSLVVLRATAVAVLLVAGTRLIPGCSNNPGETAVGKTPGGSPGTSSCSHPAPGCGCSAAGQTAPCGNVEIKSGTSVVCSEGTTTCDGSKWGTCEGNITVTTSSISGGSLRLLSLGASAQCGEGGVPSDPCDPYCNGFPGTPGGFDASPLSAGEGGLTIATPPGTCMCNEPAQPAQLAGAITVSGLPAACTGSNDAGVGTDNCNEDYECVNGTCTPYIAAGVNKACSSGPDYTLGLGCNNGTGWDLTLCNRGYVTSPGVGSLYIAIGNGTPTPAPDPGTCPWPTGPALPQGAAGENGQCIINLATTSIGAGACININVPTQCTELDGVTPLAALNAQHHWAMVNPPASILAASTPIPECDSCNNYTGLEKSEIGANSQCVNTICGTTCGGGSDAGVDGGSGCHTYVTGTVYDPGANVPLPGIAIYQPSVALTPFVPGVACDTCTSLLPAAADIVSSTASAVDGTFALEVNGTTGVPVVFQTGRWRREIMIGTDTPALTACAQNNITVSSACTWPGTDCVTRLPQTHVEGDIPLTAIAMGSAEPFECSIAQFMGGTQEMGVGGAYRIQLYRDNGEGQAEEIGAVVRSGTTAAVNTPATATGNGWITKTKAGAVLTVVGLSNLNASGKRVSVNNPTPPVQTVTGMSGLAAGFTGGYLTLWGGNHGGNNGNFTPDTYVNSSSMTISNAAGATDTNNGRSAFKWSAVGPTGVLNAAYVGGTLKLSNGGSGGNNGTWTILSVPSSSSLTVTDAGGVAPDTNNGQATLTWTAKQLGVFQITGLTGMAAGDVGNTITFSGAATGANNGPFTIVSVVNATTITITNGGAQTDANNGAIHWVETTPASVVAVPPDSSLWPVATLNDYTQVILPCDGGSGDIVNLGAPSTTNAWAFQNLGGKMFMNHYDAKSLVVAGASPFTTTATWEGGGIGGALGQAMTGRVAPSGSPNGGQTQFETWLTNQGAYNGEPSVCTNVAETTGLCTPQPVDSETNVPSAVDGFEWLRGSEDFLHHDNWGGDPTGNYNLIYSFDTNATGAVPTLGPDGGAGTGCGRTIVSSMHVNLNRGGCYSGGCTFPNSCNLGTALTPNEAAFEYLFFELSSCSVGGAPIINSAPPPPPAPPMLMPTTVELTYEATCPAGTGPVWGFFQWQATIPMGTNITFQAQTAPDNAGMPGTYGPIVPIGQATTTTAGWTEDACAVQGHLQDLAVYGNNAACTGSTPASAQASEEWLQLSITFNPAGTFAPVLSQWDQLYDCVPNQ
jgi:hypothetical protein